MLNSALRNPGRIPYTQLEYKNVVLNSIDLMLNLHYQVQFN